MKPVLRWTRALALVVVPTGILACSGDDGAPTLEREAFIATFVDLRAEALLSEEGELSDEGRAVVLEEHGVVEEQLLAFTEHHGTDTQFMQELWDEVEERLDALRPEIDEGGDLVRPIQRPTERIREEAPDSGGTP